MSVAEELVAEEKYSSRSRRKRAVPAITISTQRLTKREILVNRALYPASEIEANQATRPRLRSDCETATRPCPYVGCKHHLFLDVSPETGAIKLNFPDLEPDELEHTCALDIAALGGATLEVVGGIMNLTRERSRQIEIKGLLRIKEASYDRLRELNGGSEGTLPRDRVGGMDGGGVSWSRFEEEPMAEPDEEIPEEQQPIVEEPVGVRAVIDAVGRVRSADGVAPPEEPSGILSAEVPVMAKKTKTGEILETVKAHPGWTGAEVADFLSEPVPSTSAMLSALERRGILRSEGSRPKRFFAASASEKPVKTKKERAAKPKKPSRQGVDSEQPAISLALGDVEGILEQHLAVARNEVAKIERALVALREK